MTPWCNLVQLLPRRGYTDLSTWVSAPWSGCAPCPLGEGECRILLLHDVEQFARLPVLISSSTVCRPLLALLVTLAAAGDPGPRDGPHCGGVGLAGSHRQIGCRRRLPAPPPYGAKAGVPAGAPPG